MALHNTSSLINTRSSHKIVQYSRVSTLSELGPLAKTTSLHNSIPVRKRRTAATCCSVGGAGLIACAVGATVFASFAF